jgi:hypothetical protein
MIECRGQQRIAIKCSIGIDRDINCANPLPGFWQVLPCSARLAWPAGLGAAQISKQSTMS